MLRFAFSISTLVLLLLTALGCGGRENAPHGGASGATANSGASSGSVAVPDAAASAGGSGTPGTMPPGSCIDNGVIHANGSTWGCSDGCNTCSCDNGATASTLVACAEAGAADASPANDAVPDANLCSQPPAGCARAFNGSPCRTGFICDPTQGCTPSDCFACDPQHGWMCSADCGGGLCVPAADAGASGATCPSVEPRAGDPCAGPIACSYTGSCGPVVWACSASKSYWTATSGGKCSGACPPSEPKQGDPCMAGGKCSYKSACGSQDTIYCDGTGVVMKIDVGACPTCPAQEPGPLSPCSGALSCMYTNSCAGTDVANCMGSQWTVLRGDCEK